MISEIPSPNAPSVKVSSVGETINIEEYIAMTDLPIEDHANEPADYEADEFTSKDVDSDAYESTIDEDEEEELPDLDDEEEDEEDEEETDEDEEE